MPTISKYINNRSAQILNFYNFIAPLRKADDCQVTNPSRLKHKEGFHFTVKKKKVKVGQYSEKRSVTQARIQRPKIVSEADNSDAR